MAHLPRDDFGHAFGDALKAFLETKNLSQAEVAKRLRLGKGGVARLGTYLADSTDGKRRVPRADFLYKICSQLEFEFEYQGCRISARSAKSNGTKRPRQPVEQQLQFPFDGQFNLKGREGTVNLSIRRSTGSRKLSVSFVLESA
jgi:transcriptional regulator with XRE-family HTH domain